MWFHMGGLLRECLPADVALAWCTQAVRDPRDHQHLGCRPQLAPVLVLRHQDPDGERLHPKPLSELAPVLVLRHQDPGSE